MNRCSGIAVCHAALVGNDDGLHSIQDSQLVEDPCYIGSDRDLGKV